MTQLCSRYLAVTISVKDSQAIHKTLVGTLTGLPLTKGVEYWQKLFKTDTLGTYSIKERK